MRYQTTEKLFPALGTLNAITIRSPEWEAARNLETLNAVKAMVLHLNDLLSLYKEDSELSAINSSAGKHPAKVSEETYEIFESAIRCAQLTDGAFDITAGDLSLLWKESGKENRVPNFFERKIALGRTGYRNIVLSGDGDHQVYLKKPGMKADLGGIAKGYAADRARALLQKAGIREATLNFGGTVCAIGTRKEVGIQNPFSTRAAGAKTVGLLEIRDEAVVTSGSYEQSWVVDGKRYHHIIDPRTGYPASSGLIAVTLVGKNAMELDALATGCFVLGPEKSVPLLKERGIGGVFIGEDGAIYVTEDLRPRFRVSREAAAGV